MSLQEDLRQINEDIDRVYAAGAEVLEPRVDAMEKGKLDKEVTFTFTPEGAPETVKIDRGYRIEIAEDGRLHRIINVDMSEINGLQFHSNHLSVGYGYSGSDRLYESGAYPLYGGTNGHEDCYVNGRALNDALKPLNNAINSNAHDINDILAFSDFKNGILFDTDMNHTSPVGVSLTINMSDANASTLELYSRFRKTNEAGGIEIQHQSDIFVSKSYVDSQIAALEARIAALEGGNG